MGPDLSAFGAGEGLFPKRVIVIMIKALKMYLQLLSPDVKNFFIIILLMMFVNMTANNTCICNADYIYPLDR